MSVADICTKERTLRRGIPADNLLVHHLSSEVHIHWLFSCGFQPLLFPFQAKSLLLTSLYEEGLAVHIKTSLNIWLNNCQGSCTGVCVVSGELCLTGKTTLRMTCLTQLWYSKAIWILSYSRCPYQSRRLDQMTSRNPFQSQPFHDVVILWCMCSLVDLLSVLP